MNVVCCLSAVALTAIVPLAQADAGANPYSSIVERNPFGLKPPPPPPDPTTATPPTPPATVILTGIHSMFGPARALLEITEQEAGKAATPKKPILREGEALGSVEVLSIDIDKSIVRIRNGPIETNLTFVAKTSPTGPTGSMPAPPPPLNPNMLGGAAAPTVISPNAGAGRGGVTMAGGTTPTTGAGVAPMAAYRSGMGNVPPVPGLSIPPRAVRTDNYPAMTKEQADLLLELNRIKNEGRGLPPLPPTQFTSELQGTPSGPPSPRPSSGSRPPPLPGMVR